MPNDTQHSEQTIEDAATQYVDKWGDTWRLIRDKYGELAVQREKDGNIGGWWNGKGLIKL